ncbi:hypothetical protein [Chlorobaculum limnaeum]|uniref:hypothetical protein n=1 Tax=Chlorobaculum limnaeum TaxID=274537 RepID=UPI001969D1A1|nr:hypothetical protein [Chlorobaculum limnaeum]
MQQPKHRGGVSAVLVIMSFHNLSCRYEKDYFDDLFVCAALPFQACAGGIR